MIIALNGYAGSGKDAVATIIQYLNCHGQVTSLTLEEILMEPYEHVNWLTGESGWEIKRFSGKLKIFASMLTGIPVHKLDDQDVKRQALDRCWWTINEDGEEPMTVRDLLQKLGTDAIRDGLHPDAWVNALMADYGSLYEFPPDWIITDCRFPNEAEAVKDRGGVVIRIDRPGVGPVNRHPSETALDNWDFDYKIMNGSDIHCLRLTTEVILNKIL